MSARQNAPVIVRRKKITGGDGHHGGAWKVAYADFVTAMMAFFMLMWLLNATTEKQRKGIADYFSPTIPINRISGGGEGSFGGNSVFTERTLARNGTGASNRSPTEANAARGISGTDPQAPEDKAIDEALRKVEEALTALAGESMVSDGLLRHIVTRVTDEGLIVELFDTPGESLFEAGGDTPTAILEELVAMIVRVFSLVDNGVAINGFTRSEPVVLIRNPVWDLSSSRADRVRRMLEEGGLEEGRIQRVSGWADRKPAARNPMAPRNNRLELILLRDPAKR
jgi:chemotaxis protein MotB